jgi:hypothetical protein
VTWQSRPTCGEEQGATGRLCLSLRAANRAKQSQLVPGTWNMEPERSERMGAWARGRGVRFAHETGKSRHGRDRRGVGETGFFSHRHSGRGYAASRNPWTPGLRFHSARGDDITVIPDITAWRGMSRNPCQTQTRGHGGAWEHGRGGETTTGRLSEKTRLSRHSGHHRQMRDEPESRGKAGIRNQKSGIRIQTRSKGT